MSHHPIALFGAGRIGKVHAANVAANPRLALRYVVDPDATEAATALAAGHGAEASTAEAALADPAVAGVVIASSTNTHLELCLAAAAAGKAVFCEKPLDLDLDRALAAAPELAAARLLVGFNRRFDPHFSSLKSRLDRGEVGRLESLNITSLDPAPPPVAYVRVSGGLFRDMSIHDLDLAAWLLGEPPEEVFAAAGALTDPAIGAAGDVDSARILLRAASGRLCLITNSRRSGYGYDQRIEAFGSGGMIGAANVLEDTVETRAAHGSAGAPLLDFFLTRYAAAYRLEMDHFADVFDGAAAAVGLHAGLVALALAEAAEASLRASAPVRPRKIASPI